MRDGIFALPPKNTALLEGYKTTYGNLPPQMAQVAYDALTVLSQAHTRAGGLQGNLLHPGGFTTPSGPLRFNETGLPERSYPLRNITQRTYQTVVPLPTAMPTPLPTPLHPTEKQTWNWFNFGAPSGREAFPETDTYTPQPERQLPPQPWEKPEEVQPVPQKRPEKSLFQRFIPW